MNPFLPMHIQDNLLLASASPRRKEILERLGFEFDVIPADVREEEVCRDDPVSSAKLLAELKGVEVQRMKPRRTIIAADTAVVCEGKNMGKPGGPAEAADMLQTLSGRSHEVITGIALLAPPNMRIIEAEITRVFMRELAGSEISAYIDTGEPFDKAGAYAIQGFASAFVEKIEGCYFNVVGLPVPRLFRMFRELEQVLEADRSRRRR